MLGKSVELLLTNGADPSLQTLAGLTAFDVAASKGHEDIVNLIHAVDISQSSSTWPVLTTSEIAANVDNKALKILNKTIDPEKMFVEKATFFVFAQYKKLDKILLDPYTWRNTFLMLERISWLFKFILCVIITSHNNEL